MLIHGSQYNYTYCQHKQGVSCSINKMSNLPLLRRRKSSCVITEKKQYIYQGYFSLKSILQYRGTGLVKKKCQRKIVNIFLPINFSIYFGCSKHTLFGYCVGVPRSLRTRHIKHAQEFWLYPALILRLSALSKGVGH